MTSPIVVGSVAVEVQASARGFAKTLRDEVVKQFKGVGIDKAIQDALSKRKIKIPVEPTMDDKSTPRAPRTRTTSPATDADPLLKAFQEDVRRQIRTLAKQSLKIPVTADTEELRSGIAAGLESIRRHSKVQIPTEPADRREYERQLSTLVREVSGQVKANVPLEVPKAEAVRQVRSAADVASRSARVRLRVDVDRASLREATSALSGLAASARGVAGSVVSLGKVGAVGGAAAAGIAGLASAAGGAVQLLVGLASAAATASGSLFALPGAAAVAGAGIGALALGFVGLADAIKESATVATDGGSAYTDAARQVAQAQRGVASAERGYQAALRESQRAREDLNRALKAAQERLDDLSRSVRGAQLDEREAALRVQDALDDLRRAQATGNSREVERAQLAYEQAALALENAKDAAHDLADEQADAVRRGVQGSDEVQAALDRQQSAADSLASATEQLASAQESLAAATQGGSGGLAKAQQAMALLAPAARDVVRALTDLLPVWRGLVQQPTQQTLFAGVAGDLQRLSASILPTARDGFVGLAQVLNTQLRGALAELSTAETRINLGTIFTNAKKALDGLTVAVRPLIQAITTVAAVGSGVVAEQTGALGQLVARVSAQLTELAKSGELKAIIDSGLEALKAFGAAATDVFGIVKGIFTAVPAGGGGLLSLLDTLNQVVNSVQGQNALTTLFANLNTVGQALAPVLLTVAHALGPVSAAIAQVAVAFAPTLVNLVQSLGGALASLAPAFIALAPLVDVLASGFQPLADILVGLVTSAAPGLALFAQGLVAGLQALAPAAAPLGQALGALAEAVAPLLPVIGTQLANVLTFVSTLVTGLSSEFGPLISVFGQVATTVAGALLPVILRLAESVLPVMADAGIRIAEAFTPLVPVIAQIAQVFAERLALVLPQLVGVFAAIAPRVVEVGEALGGALLDALLQILPRLPDLIDAGVKLALAFTDLLVALIPVLPDLVDLASTLVTVAINSGGLEAAMVLMTIALKSAAGVVELVGDVVDALKSPFGTVSDIAGRMGRAIKDGVTSAYNAAKDLPGKIKSAIGDLGRLLYDAGKSIIQGLINGLKAMFGPLESTLTWVTDRIPDWKGPADKDRTLLEPAGQLIMQGLIGSIHAERAALRDELAAVTSDITLGADPELAHYGPATLSAPAPGAPIELRFGGDAPDSFFAWMRDNVRVYYNGSAQAAIGYGGV